MQINFIEILSYREIHHFEQIPSSFFYPISYFYCMKGNTAPLQLDQLWPAIYY